MLETVDDEYNMVVDIAAMVQIVDGNLEKEVPPEEELRGAYDWEAEEL